MRLYLDDDSAMPLLARLLAQAGHDVLLPAEVDMAGAQDPVHLTFAIREQCVLLTGNYGDFEDLHDLLTRARARNPKGASKSEIRSTKSETNSKSKIRMFKTSYSDFRRMAAKIRINSLLSWTRRSRSAPSSGTPSVSKRRSQ